MYTFLTQPDLKKPIDFIFMHLTVVNMLTIVFTLMPDIMSSFGVSHFLDDVGCKAVLYIFRVTRGLSICTTSLMSTFQAITVCPGNSKWAWLKSKLSNWIFPSFAFFWITNMLIYIYIIEMVIAKSNVTLIGHGYSDAYCQSRHFGNHNFRPLVSVTLIQDLLFVVLMMWTSLYMVHVLYRHHRRAQHVHSSSLSSQSSPENKATYSILLLVSCFVFFYCSNNIMTLVTFYTPGKIHRLRVISGILSSCYPTICPFLLMKNTKIISQFTSCQWSELYF
jgi:vomeronasal1 receptor